MKTALITGITGQDGSYLAEFLLKKNYNVVGLARRVSSPNDFRLRRLSGESRLCIRSGDVTDALCIHRVLQEIQPDEVYNLAAQSHVQTSFGEPSHTWAVTAQGCLNILESLRVLPEGRKIRFYQASSSEMFGSAYSTAERQGVREKFQDENTSFSPNSPYAIAKLAAHHAVRVYRESYGLFACGGILFNHESPRRGEEFVTRKISRYIARCQREKENGHICLPPLKLGCLDAKRDWGHAEDYVRAMWLMLQQDKPDDFVIATGETHSVLDYLQECRSVFNLTADETPIEIDASLYRPCEVPYLCGHPVKAKRILGWEPKTSFPQLVYQILMSDYAEA